MPCARPLFGWIAAAATALGRSPAAGGAGSFSISPLRVEFSQRVKTAALTVRNEGDAPVIVQASTLHWAQQEGTDALTPTRDLLVSPAVFTIQPGGSQLVRVALRREVDPARELSYRLLLDEVPPVAAPEFTGLQVALRLSLPVFVAPTSAAAPAFQWQALRTAEGDLAVTLRNDGNAHVQIKSFSLAPVGAEGEVLQQVAPGYVLPGQARTWTLPSGARQLGGATRLRLSGLTDHGEIASDLNLPDP
jgi:fimbrial chaperone protein